MASDIISPALGPPMLSAMSTLTWKGKSKPTPGVMPMRRSPSTFSGRDVDGHLLLPTAYDERDRLARATRRRRRRRRPGGR